MIALGRAMLALLFLVSIWLDHSQPPQSPAPAYALLLVYVLFALGIAALTWRNWWLDARLALPLHVIDMAVFTIIVFSTDGYTSPFFLFFLLPLLSAAIRWGWRETTMTASALVILFMAAGAYLSGSEVFELQRFIVRSGHLLILSAVLIWFGMHQQFTKLFFGVDELDRRLARDAEPLAQALDLAMRTARALGGALIVRLPDEQRFAGLCIDEGAARRVKLGQPLMLEPAPVTLFRLAGNRALSKSGESWYRFRAASKVIDCNSLRELGAGEGFIAEVRTGTQRGWVVLWGLAELSVDFLELGAELGRAAGAVLERDALMTAIEEGAAARTRLSLARDVHDSVVQFLAGAAFRVEAMMRGARSGGQLDAELKELKRLLIEEQGEIRAFITAVRRDREVELAEAVEELKALARRLGRQWSVDCRVDACADAEASIPVRLQFDLQQLLREAVANAVRHGGASRIAVEVDLDDEDRLRLQFKDNGSGFAPANGSPVEPWSLKERVDRAHGSLSLRSQPGCTDILITLPLTGVPA